MVDLLRNVPLGTYLDSPITWLHRLDPRVKFAWLATILLSPILSGSAWRLALAAFLFLLTLASLLPWRVWRRQMVYALFLAVLTGVITSFASDSLAVYPQPISPGHTLPAYGLLTEPTAAISATDSTLTEGSSPSSTPDPNVQRLLTKDWSQLPQSTDYRYKLLVLPEVLDTQFTISRRSLSVGLRIGTLLFTLLYSTALFLLTTAPEEITEALDYILSPTRRLKVPVAELILTLTLALRFLPLVMEEVQNILRAVRTRDIRWRMLGLKGAARAGLAMVERVFANLLVRAEQTASAMQVRGYLGPEQAVRWHVLQMNRLDWGILLGIPLFWASRFVFF